MPEEDNSLEGGNTRAEYTQGLETAPPEVSKVYIRRRPSLFKFNRLAFMVTGGALLAIGLVVVAGLVLSGIRNKDDTVSSQKGKFNVTKLSVNSVEGNEQLKVGNADKLSVNGQLKVSNTLVLAPTDAPDAPIIGQIYYNKTNNTLYYFNGQAFVPIANNNAIVSSLGGLTGAINTGTGLSAVGGTLQNTGVTSVQGQTGAVNFTANGGVTLTGTSIALTALPAGQLVLGTGASGFTSVAQASTPGQCLISTVGAPVFGSCTGTTQVTSLNGLINGLTLAAGSGINITDNGSNTITITAPASAAITQINGQTGPTLIVANATAASNVITINNAVADGATKGIAAFNTTNFSASSGVINTIQGISTTASPTFANLTSSGYLKATELRNSTDVVFTLPVTGSGTSRTLCYVDDTNTSNCPTGGNISSGTSQTPGYLTMFDASTNQITDSNLLVLGSGLQYAGTAYLLDLVAATNSTLTVDNTGAGVANLTVTGKVTANQGFLQGGDTFTLPSNGGNGGVLCYVYSGSSNCPTGGNVSFGTTHTSNKIAALDGSGNLVDSELSTLVGGIQYTGNAYLLDLTSGSNSTLTVDNSGAGVANLSVSGSVTASGGLILASGKMLQAAAGGVELNAGTGGTDTVTFYTANGAASFILPTTGGLGQTICTSQVTCAAGGGTAVLLDVGASPQSSAASTAAIFISKTAAATGNLMQLQYNGSDRFVINNRGELTTTRINGGTAGTDYVTLSGGTQTGAATLTIPDLNGVNRDICLSSGNCIGSGVGIGGSGTTNTIAMFTGTGSIGNSALSQSSGNITASGDVTIQGGDLTLGVANTQTGSISFKHSGSAFTGTLIQGALSGNQTYTLPNDSGEVCLTSGNCIGGGSGGAPSNATYLTLTNSPDLTAERVLTAGTNIAALLDGGANSTLTVSVVSNPTFSGLVTASTGLTVTANGISVTGNSTIAGTLGSLTGLTSSGTITFSGLGNGIVQSSSGLLSSGAVDRNSASLLSGTLNVANGGTGAGTFTTNGVLYGNGTSAIQATAAGTSGQILLANNSGVPTFRTMGGDVSIDDVGDTGVQALQGNPLAFTTLAAGEVLQYNGAAIVHGKITDSNLQAGTFANITGTGALAAGSIASTFGIISTGSNISTTANLQGANVNATTALQLGGNNINTAGTLSNVAYLNASSNTFSGASGMTIQGAGGLTLGTGSVAGSLVLHDGNGGQTTTLQAGNSSGNLTFILPELAGNVNQCLKKDSIVANQLVWDDCLGGSGGSGGVSTIGTIDTGGTPVANGAVISGSTLYLQSATVSYPGLVNINTQTFAGAKTFNASATFAAGLLATGATNINTSGSGVTNIGTGSASGTINIGNSASGGAVTMQSASTIDLTGRLTLQPAASLTAGQIGFTQSLTNASSSGGGVTGYGQTITVANSGSATTTVGHGIVINDNNTNSLYNANYGLSVVMGGTSAVGLRVGIQSVTDKGPAIIATSSNPSQLSYTCGNVTSSSSMGICAADTAGSNVGVGVYGSSTSYSSAGIGDYNGTGVYGINYATGGAAGLVYAGVKGRSLQTSNANAYTSVGVYGEGSSGTASTAYGGYFTLTAGSSAAAGSALYASNANTSRDILQLQDNTTTVLQVADNGATTFKNSTNSANAFQVQNAAGSDIFTVDTANSKIGTANGTSSNALTIKTGNASAGNSGALTIDTGTASGTAGNISIGTGAYAHNVTIGNATGTSALTLQGGTGGVNVTAKLTATGSGNGSSTYGALFKNGADTATAFAIQNTASTNLFVMDTTGNNLIGNGSFESGLTGWSTSGGGGFVFFNQSAGNGYIGNYGASLTTGTGSSALTYTLSSALTNGQQYTISYYGKWQTGSPGPYSNNVNIGGGACNPGAITTGTASYTLYTCTATSTGGSTVTISNASGAFEAIYLDAFTLVAGTTAAPFVGGVATFNDTNLRVKNSSGSDIFVASAGSGKVLINQSNAAFANSKLDVNGNINVTSGNGYYINGANINTAGTLGNVAYLGANNAFTGNNSFSGTLTATNRATFNGSGNGSSTYGALFRNAINSATAFNIQNVDGANVLQVDTAGGNLIGNGNFEVSTAGWSASGGSDFANVTQASAGNGYIGSYALNLYDGGGNPSVLIYTLPSALTNGQQYTISYYAKRAGFTAFTHTNNVNIGGGACNPGAIPAGPTGYAYYTCTATSTGGSTITITNNNTNWESTQFDAFTLVAGNTALAFPLSGTTYLYGNNVVRAATNNTSSFLIQNSSSTNLLSADTTNMRVSVGSQGTATGQLYVSGSLASSAITADASIGSLSIAVSGRYAYIVPGNGTNGYIRSYDVSNPSSPTYINQVATTSNVAGKKIKIQGKYAYVAGGGYLQIFDITNPNAPTSVGSVTYTSSGSFTSLYVQGRYAYVSPSGTQAIYIYDISNPANIALVYTLGSGNGYSTTSTGASDLYVQGDYLYAANNTASTNAFQIIDISNPASPSVASSISTTNGSGASVWVQGRYAYLGTTNALYAIDAKVPTSITLPSPAVTGYAVTAITSQGRNLYLTDSTNNKVRTFNTATPGTPTLISTSSFNATSPYALQAVGRYLYISTNAATQTIQTVDIGGAYMQQLEAGGLEVDQLNVRGNTSFASDASVQGSLSVGQHANIQGDMAVGGSSKFSGNLTASNYATATATYSITVSAATNTTSITVNSATGFAVGDVIFINNAGQDYFTRITNIAGTVFTVSPAVDVDANSGSTPAVTKYITQSIGLASGSGLATPAQSDRFFQGYFLGGVVTGDGSTTLSDGSLKSTNTLNLSAKNYILKATQDSASAFQVQDANGNSLLNVNAITGVTSFAAGNFTIAPSSATGSTVGTITVTAGGSLPTGTYYYKVGAVTPKGEIISSSEGSQTIAGSYTVAAPSAAPGVQTVGGGCTYNPAAFEQFATTFTTVNGETTIGPGYGYQVTGNNNAPVVTPQNSADSNVTSRKIYQYVFADGYQWIHVGTIAGNSGGSLRICSVPWPFNYPPGTNTAVVAGAGNALTVNYSTVTGATAYKIYRGTSSGTEKYLATVTAPALSYVDYGSVPPDNNQPYPGSHNVSRFGVGTTTPLATIDVRGDSLLRSTYNTSSAFQVQNASSVNAIQVSTNNLNLSGINAADATLKVAKDSVTNRSISAAGSMSATSFIASNGDFAEWIPWTDEKPPAGTIIEYNGQSMVVSSMETAAFIGNDGIADGDSILVAFAGQVPVRITGTVNAGDYLVPNGDGTARGVSPSAASFTDYFTKVGTAVASGTDGTVLALVSGPGASSAFNPQATGSFADLNITGGLTTNTLTVTGLATLNGGLTLAGHFKSTQAVAPTISTPANCGVSPTAVVGTGSTDSAGAFRITSGTGGPATCDTTITFNSAYGAAPKSIIVTAQTKDGGTGTAAARQIYVSSSGATSFTVKMGSAPADSEVNWYYYWIVE